MPRGKTKKGPRPSTYHQTDEDGCIQVTCWCERKVVRVHLDVVMVGNTVSCGHKECHA